MADTCATCGAQLGFTRRLTGATECADCAAKRKQAQADAKVEYRALIESAASGNADLLTLQSTLPSVAERASLQPQQTRDMNWSALMSAFDRSLADEVITADEEDRLVRLAESLGFGRSDFERAIEHKKAPVFIARVNDGRLPEFDSTRIMLKKGEVAHLETSAALLKEVQIREFRGGSRGVSFRIAKGVSYRVGASRGQMHVIGTELQTQDEGTLTITSKRAVFAGVRKTIEVSFAKLLGMNVYTDGVQFHVSNRQNPSLFRVESGPMVAAAVNGATQRLDL